MTHANHPLDSVNVVSGLDQMHLHIVSPVGANGTINRDDQRQIVESITNFFLLGIRTTNRSGEQGKKNAHRRTSSVALSTKSISSSGAQAYR
jgi:hypothetical protein